MRPLVDLVQEERELTLEGGRAVGVVVGEARALVRPHEDDPGHAHLDVLGVLEVAVVHVRAFVARLVDVGEVAEHRHRDRDLGHAVEEGDRVAEAVPVDRVRVVQVRPREEPDVGEDEEELLVLVDAEDRRGNLHLALEVLGDLGDRVVRVRLDEAEHVQVGIRVRGPAGQGDVPVGRHEPPPHRAGRELRLRDGLAEPQPALPSTPPTATAEAPRPPRTRKSFRLSLCSQSLTEPSPT